MTIQDTYTAASGQAIYAGMNSPSSGGGSGSTAWIPPVGQYANISQNTLASVAPAGWPSAEGAGPFINWGGAVWAPDYCDQGAWIIYGSGHLASGPEWSGIWAFRLDTLAWECANRPPNPFDISTPLNNYAESIDPSTLGHPYIPHVYDGLIYQSAANGGGPKGSLLRFFIGGSDKTNCVHRWDLSQPIFTPPTRVIDQIVFNNGIGAYPASALDEARGGVWVTNYYGVGPLKFVKFSDWSVTTFQNASYNEFGDQSLTYIPAPYDCLVGMGRSGGGGVNFAMYVCPIVNGIPQGFTKCTMTGTPPPAVIEFDGSNHGAQCGSQWSTILNKLVSYQGVGLNTVYKCTPPSPANLAAGNWQWDPETLTGANGATPSNCAPGNPSNGTWSRFIELPAQRSFIYCGGVAAPTQAWRLQGM